MKELEQYITYKGKHGCVLELEEGLEKAQKGTDAYLIDGTKKLLNKYSDATRTTYDFPNGYRASVITGRMFHEPEEGELYEIAVLKKDQENEWHIAYDTPVGEDVLRYLTPQRRDEVLQQIFTLPSVQ